MWWYGDNTFWLLIPALIFSFYAQWKVQASFSKYAEVRTRRGLTGAQVAQAILQQAGIHDVGVEPVPGTLSDHYDPRSRTLRLSDTVYGSDSIAAVSVAAHEAGHAMQHAQGYAPLALRSVVAPVASIGTWLAFPILFIGMLLHLLGPALNLAILLYLGVVVFTVITLPVEFDASGRAVRVLAASGFLYEDELRGARSVLSAAALTYVAATASAVLTLLRLLLLREASRR